jgi:hypothetical protein
MFTQPLPCLSLFGISCFMSYPYCVLYVFHIINHSASHACHIFLNVVWLHIYGVLFDVLEISERDEGGCNC